MSNRRALAVAVAIVLVSAALAVAATRVYVAPTFELVLANTCKVDSALSMIQALTDSLREYVDAMAEHLDEARARQEAINEAWTIRRAALARLDRVERRVASDDARWAAQERALRQLTAECRR